MVWRYTTPEKIAYEERSKQKSEFLKSATKAYLNVNHEPDMPFKQRIRHTSASNRKTVVYLPAKTTANGAPAMTGPLAPKEKEDW